MRPTAAVAAASKALRIPWAYCREKPDIPVRIGEENQGVSLTIEIPARQAISGAHPV